MNERIANLLRATPTPMAGLALGVASLGWSWEAFLPLHGWAQASAAGVAVVLLFMLLGKFVRHPRLLREELAHPVVGSVLPTFAMALMVVSVAVGLMLPKVSVAIWLIAVGLHLTFLSVFIRHRMRAFRLHHMVPAWFVPPVGLIVADVTFPGTSWLMPLAHALLYFGLVAYAVMLPVMLYRLIFAERVPDAAKPTIAILAAPASLGLAGYLNVTAQPQPLLVALLASIAVLMTLLVYVAFLSLLRLPFSPGYAAFTFPMVIGVTAQVKLADWLVSQGMSALDVASVRLLSDLELVGATLVVFYVAWCYVLHFMPRPWMAVGNGEARG